ncbi:MAG: transglutaminase domain-containing protein [Planctomycetes bacterium]|nr:transglutaminase domain-containing protein [Planctomycetota bacterium]
MRLLRSFPIMVIAMVMLSILGVCIAQQTVPLLLFAATLAAVSWYVTEGPRGRTLPRWASNLLALAVVVGAAADLLLPPNDVLEVLGRFTVGLTLIKLYERRTARDHAHLMGLSLLLILMSCIRTRELLFGVVLVLYAGLGLHALLLLQLYAANERVTAARRGAHPEGRHESIAAPLAVATAGVQPAVGRRVGLHFRLLGVIVAVCGLALSLAIFIIFPRGLGNGILAPVLGGAAVARTTGYSDEIDLYAGMRITESRHVVGEMKLRDVAGRTIQRDGVLHLRGAVLDRYGDGRWSVSRGLPERVETTGLRPTVFARQGLEGVGSGGAIEQEFRFTRAVSTLVTAYVPVALDTPEPMRLHFDRVTQQIRSPRGGMRRYTIIARPHPPEPLLRELVGERAPPPPPRPSWGTHTIEARLQPYVRDRLDEAGLSSVAPEGAARWRWSQQVARVLTDHFGSGDYTYSLDLSGMVRDRADPVEEFVFMTRRGHCEFFASALALMCRSVGVEARVVSGYAVSEYDERDERYVIRASNAHAWVEVRTGPHRFRTYDPTPSTALPPASAPEGALAERLGRFYQRLEGSWTQRVIDFDQDSQEALLGSLSAAWTERIGSAYTAAKAWTVRVNQAFRLGPAGYIWLGIVGLAVIIAVVALVTVLRRTLAVRRALRVERLRFAESRRLVRSLGFYVDMLQVLREAGLGKPHWQPPLAYARRLRTSRPEAAQLVREIAETYYRARYARRRLSRRQLDRVRQRVGELATTLESRS